MRLFFLALPWLELLSLIQLGIETSALFALGWVFAMILLGSLLIRRVGVSSINRLREAQMTGVLQQHLFVDDMAVVVAGLLLFIPGLLSDFFALVILIGPLRRWLARLLGFSVHTQTFSSGKDDSDGVIIEGEYDRTDRDRLP
ncbi:FxsA cytoplasmic membrane protein [Luminiphilus syltensis NOR5-1B]|uniref:FxsA cytoplasmic membrane protein n=1 Tax=Luminiphilus syltensis NOR5-1B TaxID=565045 RepID=B8KWZ9_9GAMM|nr:FxsA family protein [Luminiphilus syltensis]EED35186.1 FxsA cytoplasmic membrane protein [Luminiphilus syltensis NOR5-1B]